MDAHEVAFIDDAMPDVDPLVAEGAGAEQVAITSGDEDNLTTDVRVHSAGLIVFSEIYEQGWAA